MIKINMARARPRNWKKMCELTFSSVIRGHHVYKEKWKPTPGEILYCREDNRDEAKQYDEYSVGVFREQTGLKSLVGHVPIELSFLVFTFLTSDSGNVVLYKVSGARKLENGLVVPATFIVRTATFIVRTVRKKIFEKIKTEIDRNKNICKHMNIDIYAHNVKNIIE